VADSLKKKKFHLTPKVILRIIIFALIIYLSISLLSQPQGSSSVLGQQTSNPFLKEYFDKAYNALPPQSRSTLENYSSSPQALFVEEKINILKQETAEFPQKQIKEIQKAIVDQIYSNIIKNIEQ
jgi:hypothetical protein